MSRFVVPSAIVAALLAFVPWGSVSVQILGAWSPGLTFKGTEIGSGIGGIEAGWVVVILAGVALFATRSTTVLRVTAALLLAFTIYSAATLAHHTLGITANGQDISQAVGARVSIGWGSVAEIIAALALLIAALSSGAGRVASPVVD